MLYRGCKGSNPCKTNVTGGILGFLSGRSWQTLNFKTNKICQQYVGPCFSYNPHYFFYFFCQANSKAPEVKQFFHTLLLTITRLLFCLWTDPVWSRCYSLEKFNCRSYYYYWSLLYSVILRSRPDSLRSHVILHEWLAFYSAFSYIHRTVHA